MRSLKPADLHSPIEPAGAPATNQVARRRASGPLLGAILGGGHSQRLLESRRNITLCGDDFARSGLEYRKEPMDDHSENPHCGSDPMDQKPITPPQNRRSALLDAPTLRAMSAASAYSATELAEQLAVSPRHLRRLFVRHFGCTPVLWLREERLQAALRLLPAAASVKEVAHALAFRHTSHFCRDFRARFGYRPSELVNTTRARVT